MNWNIFKHLPNINGVTLRADDQINGNLTGEALGWIPMSDLVINEIFRSQMGYQYVQANFHSPDFKNIWEVK
jgi:hypothetical protein